MNDSALKCPCCSCTDRITLPAMCTARWEDGAWVHDDPYPDPDTTASPTCGNCDYHGALQDFETAAQFLLDLEGKPMRT